MRSPSLPWLLLVALPACLRSPPDVPEPVARALTSPTASAVPAAPSAPPPGVTASASATPAEPPSSCRVAVGAVLHAERFAGPGPISPSLQASLDSDPKFARTYWGFSHGDQHIQCRYRVRINGAAYAFTHIVGNTWGTYDVGRCELVRADVEREIRQVTRSCADLTGGAYYGYVFTPMP